MLMHCIGSSFHNLLSITLIMENKSWLDRNNNWIIGVLVIVLIACLVYIWYNDNSPKETETKDKLKKNEKATIASDSNYTSKAYNAKKASKRVVSESVRTSQEYKLVKDTNREVMVKKILSYE